MDGKRRYAPGRACPRGDISNEIEADGLCSLSILRRMSAFAWSRHGLGERWAEAAVVNAFVGMTTCKPARSQTCASIRNLQSARTVNFRTEQPALADSSTVISAFANIQLAAGSGPSTQDKMRKSSQRWYR